MRLRSWVRFVPYEIVVMGKLDGHAHSCESCVDGIFMGMVCRTWAIVSLREEFAALYVVSAGRVVIL